MSIGPTLSAMWRRAVEGSGWGWTAPSHAWSTKQLREFLREVSELDGNEKKCLRRDLVEVVEHEERAEYERLKAKFG